MGFIGLICLISHLPAVIASAKYIYAQALAPEFIVLDDLETPPWVWNTLVLVLLQIQIQLRKN
jgi:hypothetical protein